MFPLRAPLFPISIVPGSLFHLPLLVMAPLLGLALGMCTASGTRRAMQDLKLPPDRWPGISGIAGAVLGGLFVWGAVGLHSQNTPEVVPDEFWRDLRVLFHLSLIWLLLIITTTDLRSYFILNWCTQTGIIIGLLGAVVSGQFQLAHVWVDWNAEIPQLRGPYLPAWLASHPHLHGLAWSLAGIVCGTCLTWVIRKIGSFILGMNALGSGDVWLMAMVGAYLGWQPVVVITLLAPILALGIGGIERICGNRAALPYGPFLALATFVVLCCWRSIWMAEISLTAHAVHDRASIFAVRRFFGDPVSMLLVTGLSLGLLVGLLGLLRLYKSLPVRNPKSS